MAEFSAPYPALSHPASQDPRVKSPMKGWGQSVALEQAHPFLSIVTQQLFIEHLLCATLGTHSHAQDRQDSCWPGVWGLVGEIASKKEKEQDHFGLQYKVRSKTKWGKEIKCDGEGKSARTG